MTLRRVSADAGIIAALGLATYLISRSMFDANPKLLI